MSQSARLIQGRSTKVPTQTFIQKVPETQFKRTDLWRAIGYGLRSILERAVVKGAPRLFNLIKFAFVCVCAPFSAFPRVFADRLLIKE